jgi:glycerol-3-phosphate dehydrogenase
MCQGVVHRVLKADARVSMAGPDLASEVMQGDLLDPTEPSEPISG